MESSLILTREYRRGVDLRNRLSTFRQEFNDCPILVVSSKYSFKESYAEVSEIFASWDIPDLSKEDIGNMFPSLRKVFYIGGDSAHFENTYKALGISVYNAKAENSIPVSEFVLAHVILSNKGYYNASARYKKFLWYYGFKLARSSCYARRGNYKSTIGLIGFGAVAKELFKRLSILDCEILIYDPTLTQEQVKTLGISLVSLEDLFKKSDVISNHLPDNRDTKRILGSSLFRLMKANVTFINTGRGAQIDEFALSWAILKRPHSNAILDVVEKEPLRPWSIFNFIPRIRLSPHIAGSSPKEVDRMIENLLGKRNSA